MGVYQGSPIAGHSDMALAVANSPQYEEQMWGGPGSENGQLVLFIPFLASKLVDNSPAVRVSRMSITGIGELTSKGVDDVWSDTGIFFVRMFG